MSNEKAHKKAIGLCRHDRVGVERKKVEGWQRIGEQKIGQSAPVRESTNWGTQGAGSSSMNIHETG